MIKPVDYNKYFKNYNFINNFSFAADDYISDMLVKNYQMAVYNADVNNDIDVDLVKKIDNIMNIYIIDSEFFKVIQDKLKDNDDNYIQDLNTILINEYNLFKNGVTGFISNSRWI